ncbi:MAG: xanthine dehydrogenase family protein subunit M [Rhodobacteraceae bacterium]|nr:xanthine dehydrogenase family protein subunit M [Paracoccaceae bacterium]
MQYAAPNKARRAVELLAGAKGTARVLAGGTDLLVQMKSGMIAPDLLVDIKNIKDIATIRRGKNGFRIGAAVSCAVLGECAELVAAWPGVVEAANLIGSTQVQGRCTMTGNLCNASPAADSVPALVAADATARIIGPDGKRECPVQDIPTGPGRTSLAKGEFITALHLPPRPERAGDAYLRFIPRTEMDIAVCSAGVSLTLDKDGRIATARVALGAVAPTVLLVNAAAEAIIGSKLDDAALAALAAACSAACQPIDDKRGTIEFRTEVAGVLARRAARIAYTRAGGQA